MMSVDFERGTVAERNFDSTDDCCVFIDDTFSQEVADKVIHGCSPSAKAFLSPQRQPVADAIPFGNDEDESHKSSTAKEFPFPPPPPPMVHNEPEASSSSLCAAHSSTKRRRFSTGRALMDMTNRDDSLGRSSTGRASLPLLGGSCGGTQPACLTPKLQIVSSTSPPAQVGPTFAELHKLERERDRYKRMYEHQKELAEKAMVLEGENYDKLQAKIVEVVALQSRCEETKRFVRQLKKEILGVRQRELPVHNKIAEDARLDVVVREKFSKILTQQRENFEAQLAVSQDRLDSVENLLADVSTIACMRPGGSSEDEASPIAQDPIDAIDNLRDLEKEEKIPEAIQFDVKKLDRLLTESYYESTALVNELRRSRRDLEKETDRRMELEAEMSRIRKQNQEVEVEMMNDRRKMMISDEVRAESHAQLKSEILMMREELIQAREVQNPVSTSRGRSLSSGGFSSASSSDDDCYRVHYNRAGSEGVKAGAFSALGSKGAPSVSPNPTLKTTTA